MGELKHMENCENVDSENNELSFEAHWLWGTDR